MIAEKSRSHFNSDIGQRLTRCRFNRQSSKAGRSIFLPEHRDLKTSKPSSSAFLVVVMTIKSILRRGVRQSN
jgi:hypothetical protein